MKIEYMICTFVFILVIVVIIITLTKNKEKFADGVTTNGITTSKTLKYFGGGYCPYSNKDSNAYNVINEFSNSKKDVQVEYYWTETNQNDMEKYKIMYVPTNLGKDDTPIELKLPDDYNKAGKSDAELKEALMNHIYTLL
jgi:hypothetical protein